MRNLEIIDHRNQAEGSMVHGVTKFVDLTASEFKTLFRGKVTKKHSSRHGAPKVENATPLHIKAEGMILESVDIDWSQGKPKTYTSAIKNQNNCGCCW